jgi:hypothetical protein
MLFQNIFQVKIKKTPFRGEAFKGEEARIFFFDQRGCE